MSHWNSSFYSWHSLPPPAPDKLCLPKTMKSISINFSFVNCPCCHLLTAASWPLSEPALTLHWPSLPAPHRFIVKGRPVVQGKVSRSIKTTVSGERETWVGCWYVVICKICTYRDTQTVGYDLKDSDRTACTAPLFEGDVLELVGYKPWEAW